MIDSLAVDYSVLDPNDGDFDSTKQRLGVEFHENGKGVAIGDLDGNGFIDVIGTNSNGETFNSKGERTVAGGPLFVWMNSGGDNNWVSFRLSGRMKIDGTGSNADGIGAKIIISHQYEGRGKITQTKVVLGSSSFLSMSSLDSHFGVGDADSVTVTVEWPSGRTTTEDNISINRIHEITEPDG